jgi:tetratricopeptide (TPR) repeat protein
MNTIKSIQTTEMVEPMGTALLTGIRELSRGNDLAALETFAGALDGSLGALCTARLQMLRREHDEARQTLEGLIEREPEIAEAHYLLGIVHRAGYRTFDAIRCFRQALRLDPWNSRAASELSDLLDVQEP